MKSFFTIFKPLLTKTIPSIALVIVPTLQVNAQSALDKRINALVDAMTTQEKIDQLINSSFGGTPVNARLGIPGFFMDDGPHGVRLTTDKNGRTATAFPTGIAMASTWDEEMALKVGEAMGVEFWAFNRNEQLGPCIDLCRDPRGGRSAESGGEDAYLAGHIGKSVAIGIQESPIVATVKHYMGESKQSNRHRMDVLVSDRWLMDFSGYNFRTVIQDAGVMSVMGAYNLINGDKACESTLMQTTILRERWGYPFYVVSDWDAIWDSQKALKAGTDICMGSSKYANDLPGLAASGAVSNADLDRAVKNVLRTKILNGMLDYFPRGDVRYAKTAEINAINQLAAKKSIILLKNEKGSNGVPILPLKKTGIKIALIGPNATGENLNCYGSSETFPPYSISLKEGLEAKIGAANIQYSLGCDINSDSRIYFDEAKAMAASADVVIFAGGLNATQEGEGYNTGNDRKNGSINLPGQQLLLIQQLSAINPNIIVVVQSGGVCGLNYCIDNIKGLLYSFYAAQEAGTAIADVLFGDYNPAGRMPVTMPKKDTDLPSWYEDSFRKFTDNLDGGYRWFDEKNITPEFVFGYGLSYTTFAYSNMTISEVTDAGQPFTVSVDVTNTGNIAGEEVAQLYIGAPSTPEVWMPKKHLRGFKRISLQSGETKTVTFKLTADDFYYWNGTQYQAQSGTFTLNVGGSSTNFPLTKEIALVDGVKKPDLRITQLYTMPRYPLKGQKVSFYALVKNQGNVANGTNSPYKIDFKSNGIQIASSDYLATSIAPGQVQLIASTGTWIGEEIGKSQLSGEINFQAGSSQEWDATNNQFSRNFEVFDPHLDPKVSNLAYQKPVTTSSSFGSNSASFLVDGDQASRWESARTDNEYVTVDLLSIAELQKITINWEGAYAKTYQIQSSLDGLNWTNLADVSTGAGGTESYPIHSVHARYIRIKCLERILINGVKYGFSIYELEVNGNVLQTFPYVQIAPVETSLYLPYAKTVLNGSKSGNPLETNALTYRWKQISGPAEAVIEDSTASLTMVKFLVQGTYSFLFTVGNEAGTNSSTVSITVSSPGPTSDLAFMKPTTCSGVESSNTNSDMAVDGNSTSRWSSLFQDNQWWQVDLQHQIVPSIIHIAWEAAYAKVFDVQISSDNINWSSLYSNASFLGGTSSINNTNALSGRYLKVNCSQRATTYGSSFFSFNLNGSFQTSTNHVPVANAGNDLRTSSAFTLNGSLSFDADNEPFSCKWEQIAGPSQATISQSNNSVTQVTDLKPGDYYFKLKVDDGKDVDFDVVKVVYATNTKLKTLPLNEVMVCPNPVEDYFTIQNTMSQPIDSLQLYDIQGRFVKKIVLTNNRASLIGVLPGHYYLRTFSKGTSNQVIQIVKR
ncbi:MAG TPA: glycoside hydrolase family 3 C-terminal domain-containing protein [Bacteroidales bacterium]|nr:glycoside hydrolase family 3 C-terminal domain-containing protein [Bacteroidales bacterium]